MGQSSSWESSKCKASAGIFSHPKICVDKYPPSMSAIIAISETFFSLHLFVKFSSRSDQRNTLQGILAKAATDWSMYLAINSITFCMPVV